MARWSALPGRPKLSAGAGDLGRRPFNGVAEDVGPAPAAPVVRVVVVSAVDAVVVGGFGPTGFWVAHRREGNCPGREPNSRPDWAVARAVQGFDMPGVQVLSTEMVDGLRDSAPDWNASHAGPANRHLGCTDQTARAIIYAIWLLG